jgi:hypothetical protein
MHGSSGTSKWKWLVPVIFLALFALALVRGAMINALGYLGFLVGGALYASGRIERSRGLAYLALGFFLVGAVLLVIALGRGFFW